MARPVMPTLLPHSRSWGDQVELETSPTLPVAGFFVFFLESSSFSISDQIYTFYRFWQSLSPSTVTPGRSDIKRTNQGELLAPPPSQSPNSILTSSLFLSDKNWILSAAPPSAKSLGRKTQENREEVGGGEKSFWATPERRKPHLRLVAAKKLRQADRDFRSENWGRVRKSRPGVPRTSPPPARAAIRRNSSGSQRGPRALGPIKSARRSHLPRRLDSDFPSSSLLSQPNSAEAKGSSASLVDRTGDVVGEGQEGWEGVKKKREVLQVPSPVLPGQGSARGDESLLGNSHYAASRAASLPPSREFSVVVTVIFAHPRKKGGGKEEQGPPIKCHRSRGRGEEQRQPGASKPRAGRGGESTPKGERARRRSLQPLPPLLGSERGARAGKRRLP